MILCKKAKNDSWVQAIFEFGKYWSTDSWKGTPCKVIEIDLSNAEMYAWMEGMPEPEPEESAVENVNNAVKSVKTIENGQLVIIKNGVKYNALGTEIR